MPRGSLRRYLIYLHFFVAACMLASIVIPLYYYQVCHNQILPNVYKFATQIGLGIWGSMVASIFFAWFLFIFKNKIRRLIIREKIVMRIPLMLGCAPFFFAKKDEIFERFDLDVSFLFRSAGISALDDLISGECQLAIASDIALMSYLQEDAHRYVEIYALPFVKITNQIKLLILKEEIIDDNDLAKKEKSLFELLDDKIAIVKNSVHFDYLLKLIKEENVILKDKAKPEYENIPFLETKIKNCDNVLECYFSIVTDTPGEKVGAALFWEPHYETMTKNFKLTEVKVSSIQYEWFLCLVTTKAYFDRNIGLHDSIIDALRVSTNTCETQKNNIVDVCFDLMLPEFTGLEKEDLTKINVDHIYGITDKMQAEYKQKLSKYPEGKELEMHCTWPLRKIIRIKK